MSQNKAQLIEATLESLGNVSGTPSDGQVLIWNAASGRWEPAVPPAGPEGPTGPAGPAGRAVLSGTGAPGSGVGSDGDFYIDTATSKVYGPKTAGAWGSGTSMVGPAGATGATGAAGSTTIVPPGDASFSNVSLLLLGEGTDGGTTFTDSSSGNRTVSISGSNSAVTISTAQKKFGSSSIWMQPQFTINVKHPTVTHSSALDLSNTAFTIEGWFYFTSFFGFNWSHLAIKDSSWALKITSGGHVAVSSGSFSFFPSEPQVGTVALNTWHHVAVVCDGANVSFYWNGVRKATKAGVFSDGGGAFRLGAASSGAEPMAGYIDNFRITKGVARYSGESFSPPTSAFVPSATTVLPSTPTAGQTVSDGSALYVCTSEATQSWSTLGSTGPAGPAGPAGSAGATGASAYQVALSNGFVGTEAQWLASLVGAAGSVGPAGQKGDPGDPGNPGADGVDGASAYEVAVAQGFVGTEQQWLASLIGAAGSAGQKGDPGEAGSPGQTGPAGPGVPAGGSAGQILAKSGTADYATDWVDAPAGSLAGLTDVQIGTPDNGKALLWNATHGKWEPGSPTTERVGSLAAERILLDSIASQLNGSTTTFDLLAAGLPFSPQNSLAVEVFLGGIQQMPGQDYTIIGDQIAFTTAPVHGLDCHIIGTVYSPASATISALSDVDVTGAENGQALIYNATSGLWEPGTLPTGPAGSSGSPGADGASAYEVAVAQGFAGTEQQWLASLVGPTGPQGPSGSGSNTPVTNNHTTASLANGASEDWTITGTGTLSVVRSVTTDRAAWIRLYSTSDARTADARSSPGGTLPAAGTGLLMEVATTGAQTLTLAPPAWCFTDGSIYARVVNQSGSTSAVQLSINLLVTEG